MATVYVDVSEDEAIVATNNDATSCKRWLVFYIARACTIKVCFVRYATEKGYWKDEFIKYFHKAVERKSPEISRGK